MDKMNWYRLFLESEKVQAEPNEYSWVRLDIPSDICEVHDSVTKEIDEEDLYIEEQGGEDWSYGLEDKPHITVKWEIDFDEPKKVLDCLKGEKGGTVTLDKATIFDNDKYDVLVIECKSEALQKLHKKLTKDLEIEDDYDKYTPHVTIGYFKKGKAKKYKAMAEKAFTYYLLEFKFDEVIFEDTKDKETVIKLG